jgi:hypothetical protein
VNLPESVADYEYWVSSTSDISNIFDLSFFAFLDELANPDIQTVPDFLDRYFVGLFSSDPEDDIDIRATIRSHFGIIGRSRWGRQMTHLVKVLGIALDTQCTVKLLFHGDVYLGTYLLGSNYIITDPFKGVITSHPQQQVADAIAQFFPHSRAVISLLGIVTQLGKDQEWLDRSLKSSGNFCCDMESLNTTEAQRKQIYDLAQDISFDSGYDHVTSGNLIDCLLLIADESKPIPTTTPRHPVSLFNPSRIFRALSRFGRNAPSFRVRGGRVMSLTESFVSEIQQPMRGGGNRKVTKVVGRIGAVIRPIKEAVADFETMTLQKSVINPYGNAVTRASTPSIVKVYEGSDCQAVISALRQICKVQLSDNSDPKKRKATTESDAGSSKRTKGMADVD